MIAEPSPIAPLAAGDLATGVPNTLARAWRSPLPDARLEQAGVGAGHPPQPDTAALHEAARLRSLLSDPALRVSVHEDASSGRVVMQVEKRATGEMVEQIPAERLLRLYQSLRESLVDEQA